jgi:hypothetical protein
MLHRENKSVTVFTRKTQGKMSLGRTGTQENTSDKNMMQKGFNYSHIPL